MVKEGKVLDEKMLFVICPECKTPRQKIGGKFTIVKRGKERNGLARFFCTRCLSWFNEETGNCERWRER
jgi:transposase-like protein